MFEILLLAILSILFAYIFASLIVSIVNDRKHARHHKEKKQEFDTLLENLIRDFAKDVESKKLDEIVKENAPKQVEPLHFHMQLDSTDAENQITDMIQSNMERITDIMINHLLTYPPREIDKGVVMSLNFRKELLAKLGA